MRRLPVLIAAVAVPVIVLGCVGAGAGPSGSRPGSGAASASTVPSATPALTLDGRTFLSTAVTENGVARALVGGTRIRLQFLDGRLAATAGCNTMAGPNGGRASRRTADLAAQSPEDSFPR